MTNVIILWIFFFFSNLKFCLASFIMTLLREFLFSYSGFPGYTSYLAAPSPGGDRHVSPSAIYATDLGAAQTSQLTGLQIQRSEPSPQPNMSSPLQRVSEQLINAQRAQQGLSGKKRGRTNYSATRKKFLPQLPIILISLSFWSLVECCLFGNHTNSPYFRQDSRKYFGMVFALKNAER